MQWEEKLEAIALFMCYVAFMFHGERQGIYQECPLDLWSTLLTVWTLVYLMGRVETQYWQKGTGDILILSEW